MEFTPLTHRNLDLVHPWFDDAETKRRLGGYYPVAKQLRLLEKDPARHGWLAWENGRAVGLCEFEVVEGGIGYVLILLAPAERGKGKSLALVNQLKKAAHRFKLRELQAWIAPEARASKACFQRAGYEKTGTTVDGFDLFLLTVS